VGFYWVIFCSPTFALIFFLTFIEEMELFIKLSFSGYWKSFLEFYDFLIKNSMMLFRIFAGFSWELNWGFLFSNLQFYLKHFQFFIKFSSFLRSGCATSLHSISISLQTPALKTLQKLEIKNYDDVLKWHPLKYFWVFYFNVTNDMKLQLMNWRW
jgi:hypothetical protein